MSVPPRADEGGGPAAAEGGLERRDAEPKTRLQSRRRGKRRKDAWDKLGVVAPIAQALALAMIGLIGAWWTALYNTGQLNLQKLKTAERFFSHLLSTDEREKQIALVTLGAVDGKLAADLSGTLGRGGIAALGDLSQSPNQTAAAAAVAALKVANVPGVALSKGSKAKLAITIGYALPGEFQIGLWDDASARFLPLGKGTAQDPTYGEFDLGSTEHLDHRLLRWSIVVLGMGGQDQYAVTATIAEDGKPVSGGTFRYQGTLDGPRKVIVDTVRLRVS